MEPVAEGASVTAVPVTAADSTEELAEVEGVGVVGEDNDAAARGAEAFGDSEEDGEDVFEVEKILDMKTEGVKFFTKFAGKAIRRMTIPGSPRFTWRTVKKCFLNLGRKLQRTKPKQSGRIFRDCP